MGGNQDFHRVVVPLTVGAIPIVSIKQVDCEKVIEC